jgi:hypothetical protein
MIGPLRVRRPTSSPVSYACHRCRWRARRKRCISFCYRYAWRRKQPFHVSRKAYRQRHCIEDGVCPEVKQIRQAPAVPRQPSPVEHPEPCSRAAGSASDAGRDGSAVSTSRSSHVQRCVRRRAPATRIASCKLATIGLWEAGSRIARCKPESTAQSGSARDAAHRVPEASSKGGNGGQRGIDCATPPLYLIAIWPPPRHPLRRQPCVA